MNPTQRIVRSTDKLLCYLSKLRGYENDKEDRRTVTWQYIAYVPYSYSTAQQVDEWDWESCGGIRSRVRTTQRNNLKIIISLSPYLILSYHGFVFHTCVVCFYPSQSIDDYEHDYASCCTRIDRTSLHASSLAHCLLSSHSSAA